MNGADSTFNHRRSFIDRNLLYLFSYDANLEYSREEIGLVPAGARVNIFSQPKDSRVYNVLQEHPLEGVKPISGVIERGGDWALLREDSDIGVIDVRLIIRTDDDATIHSTYSGVFPAGPRGYRRLLSEKPKLGTEEQPFVGSLVITPRYETDHPDYKWLLDHQCVGFGQVNVIGSLVRQASFDIYAMDY
jgi:hypothetical protein